MCCVGPQAAVLVLFAAPLLLAAAPLPPGLPPLAPAANCPAPDPRAGGPETADSRAIETHLSPALTGSATKPATIVERMRARTVAGLSVAVIRGGRLAWARGYGLRDTATCAPVTPETAFIAGSISKSFTATLAMREVERGRLSLDGDINASLRRWQLPPDARYPGQVTLRQLLSHTAGVSMPSSIGYPPGTPLPDIIATLDATAPAHGPAVRRAATPGAAFRYSNGGYMIVQAALEDVTGLHFEDLAARDILRPLGMTRSAFARPATPDILRDASAGHHLGKPFVAKHYEVEAVGVGGLWTTPTDLARFLIDVRAAANGEAGHRLAPASAAAMVRPGKGDWGLGFEISDHGRRFGHDGGFWGYLSKMWIDRASGDGIVVLTNDYHGLGLTDEIIRAAADHYGWADLQSRTMAAALAAGPIYVRGSMNNYFEATPLKPVAAGDYVADLMLKPGEYDFKLGSAGGKPISLGTEDDAPIEVGASARALSTDGDEFELKIVSPGIYRFRLHADATGSSTLAVARVAS